MEKEKKGQRERTDREQEANSEVMKFYLSELGKIEIRRENEIGTERVSKREDQIE